jgi:hypothetical protein
MSISNPHAKFSFGPSPLSFYETNGLSCDVSGGWKIGYSKSSTNGKDVMRTNRPILRMVMDSKSVLFETKGQWKTYPQFIFTWSTWFSFGQKSTWIIGR